MGFKRLMLRLRSCLHVPSGVCGTFEVRQAADAIDVWRLWREERACRRGCLRWERSLVRKQPGGCGGVKPINLTDVSIRKSLA